MQAQSRLQIILIGHFSEKFNTVLNPSHLISWFRLILQFLDMINPHGLALTAMNVVLLLDYKFYSISFYPPHM